MMSLPSISPLTAGKSFNARTQALTQKPMKPNLTPRVFSNRSLYLLPRGITPLLWAALEGAGMGAGVGAPVAPRARGAPRRLGPGLRTRRFFRGRSGRRGRSVRPTRRGRRGLLGGARAFPDLTEQRADRDRLAVLGRDVAEHAGGRGGHLDRYLIGLE